MMLTDRDRRWPSGILARSRWFVKSLFLAGMTLVELLVVLAIIVAVAGAITFAVANVLKKEQAKACLTNMLMIEAAKDEYARDHPGATQVGEDAEFRKYFSIISSQRVSGRLY